MAEPNLTGRTLGGYQVLEEIGQGGMAIVYKAFQPSMRRYVAIKVLLPLLTYDANFVRRFQQEAMSAGQLQHPNIVTIYDVAEQDGIHYIAMEYLEGQSLNDILRTEGSLPAHRAVRIAEQVSAALDYAHGQGFIHRDIKPGNIMVGPDDRVTLTDFGIVKALSGTSLTRTGMMVGTPEYMAPEQATGKAVGPGTDIYALGVVCYAMLAGQPPFQGDTAAVLFAHVHTPPPALRSVNPRVPAPLEKVIRRALAKEPEDRYATARALAEDLAIAAAGQAPAAAKVRPVARAASPAIRSQSRFIWIAVAAVAVVVLGLVIWISTRARVPGREATGVSVSGATVAATATAQAPASAETQASVAIDEVATEVAKAQAVAATLTAGAPSPVATSSDTSVAATSALTPTASPRTATPRPAAATVTPTPIPPTATLRPPIPTPEPQTPRAGATRARAKDGMVMVYVPAGEFLMGSTNADINAVLARCGDCRRDWYTDELPQHAVRLDAFWIDRTEVTNAQYQKCVDAGRCRVADMPLYDPQGKPNRPVVEVTWNDAQVYCQWAGARLPTEAEWAKAARGTDVRTYPWGNDMPDCNKAQYSDCGGQTIPVGSTGAGASPYGALDMAGNAWEWVADWYGSGYYADSAVNNPQGPNSGEYKVLRGGSWYDGWYYIRAATRDPYAPSNRHFNVGFRCAGSP